MMDMLASVGSFRLGMIRLDEPAKSASRSAPCDHCRAQLAMSSMFRSTICRATTAAPVVSENH